jgi:hypothetical protein
MDNLQEAYLSVYQELDEVTGRGRIDPVSDFPHHGERGSRTPKESGLKMSPLDRAEARANALKKRGDSEATKRANRIQSRFVGPTKRGLVRAIDASNVARRNEKDRLLNKEEVENWVNSLIEEGYDLSDYTWDEMCEFYLDETMSSANRKTWERLVRTKGDRPFTAPRTQGTKSARRREPDPTPPPATIEDPEEKAKQERRKKRGPLKFKVAENFEEVVEYLFVEGYTDTIESAELMAESISAEWVNEILDEKYVKALDTTGKGKDLAP